MLVKLFVSIMQLDSMSVRSVELINSLNDQLLVNLPFPIMSVMSVTSAVIANSSKHLMLLNLSVLVMQVILSFVIPLVSLFLILLVIVSKLNLLVKLKVWNGNGLTNDLLVNSRNSRGHDFTKSFSAVNFLMMSIYFYELVLLFFIFHHNFCINNVNNFFKGYVRCNNFSINAFLTSNSVAIFNIPHKYVSTSSVRFYHFSFSFYEYSFFETAFFIIFLM